jgi:heme/copper-type cytochrome/quinol oxidase subunit 3
MSQSSDTKALRTTMILIVLLVGTWAFVVIRHIAEESGPRRFPKVAYESLPEYFIVASVFLASSFLGVVSAVRLARSSQKLHRLLGCLAAFFFLLFFVFSCSVYWSEYQRYTESPNGQGIASDGAERRSDAMRG